MWGYPEFYIPVPGGYGSEHHGHAVVTAPKEAVATASAASAAPVTG
jgi:hypothetical protein